MPINSSPATSLDVHKDAICDLCFVFLTYASARNLLNCTAMDIMYYTSPLFRMEIWSALQLELNRLYQMFTQRNPTFEANGGKVSIVSHSLGNNSPAGYLK